MEKTRLQLKSKAKLRKKKVVYENPACVNVVAEGAKSRRESAEAKSKAIKKHQDEFFKALAKEDKKEKAIAKKKKYSKSATKK